ncbi:CU044_5270 family protein [Microbispora sp. RL4-1S]|uniref:CU044_5270 family protein n=1 Tax=Microbispora oryzae TaxID=2806554 RepID=A0A940WH37_9ACTN|nr:CU044_5270 family protein [Microbispora oryzae]MBP2705440.1 CU044_5270 family protein [Microbispora oryzae]
MSDQLFSQLKPKALDEMTAEAYQRRRDGDLAQAFATPVSRVAWRVPRMPLFLITGTVAAGLGIAAALVVSGGVQPAAPKPGVAVAQPSTSPALDARSFLLAAAETAAGEPAGSGRYWYTRQTTAQRVNVAPDEYIKRITSLKMELDRRSQKADSTTLDKEALLKELELPYDAYTTSTTDTWRAVRKGDTGGSVRRAAKITFGSPADEAAWKASGSPILSRDRPGMRKDDIEPVLSIGNPGITLENIADLPTDKEALKRRLTASYDSAPAGGGGLATHLWQSAVDLLTAPTTPGTRAALYQMLADQPGIDEKGEAADVTGRTGTALSTTGADDVRYDLIIDPRTAELLQYDVVLAGKTAPTLRVVIEQAGWTDRLGERPRG